MLPPVGRRLHEVRDDELPPEFARAWPQIALRLSKGGHGLRPWAEHIDAAFVGQWALAMQSSWDSAHNCSFFPVLETVVEQAQTVCDNGVSAADTLPLASDLAAAWTAVVSTGQQAVALERVEKRLPPEARLSMGQWLTDTDQRVENLRAMPDKAQRACSQAYLYLGRHAVAVSIPASEPIRRAVFLAVQGVMPARWISAIPWEMEGHFNVNSSSYRVATSRRYRLRKPPITQAPAACVCGHNAGAVGPDPIGDHEEANCSSLAGARTSTHNELARGLAEYLQECRFTNVRLEVTEWDPGDTDADPTARRARATPSNGFDARRSTRPDPTKRVPDILCTSPDGLTDYVIDCRISWNITTSGVLYNDTGDLSIAGEAEKRRMWAAAMRRHHAVASRPNVKFVPFSLEVYGNWGPAATDFFEHASAHIRNYRDVNFFHWSEASFRRYWSTALAAIVARGQGDANCRHAHNDPIFVNRASVLGDSPLGGLG